MVGTMARSNLAATPCPTTLAPQPDTVGDLPPIPRVAPLALSLGSQTGFPARTRSGVPWVVTNWYITIRGGPSPRRKGGPSRLPGHILDVILPRISAMLSLSDRSGSQFRGFWNTSRLNVR